MLTLIISQVDLQDLCNEVFDMVKPADPCRITLKDLIKCRQGMLMDQSTEREGNNKEQEGGLKGKIKRYLYKRMLLIWLLTGDIIVSIMIDVNGFWTYENREALVQAENINNR